MIVNGILTIFANVLRVLLAPLEVINVTVDFLGSIPIVASFIQVVAYLMPFDNFIPLFILTGFILSFKITRSIVGTVRSLLPF